MKKLAALTLMLLSLGSPAVAASLVELAPDSRQDAGSFQELGQIEKILTTISAQRALSVKRPIQIGLLDRKQLQSKLVQQIKDEIPPDKLRGEAALYQQLGMLPAGFDYQTFLTELYTEQIGGFYDPKTRELKLIKGTPLTGMEQQMLIAHELVHALQDQHYQLGRYMDAKSGNDDRNLAQMALIEGDATVAASEYLQARASQKPLQGLLEVLGSVLNAARQMPGFEKFRSAPAFIRDSLIFPYDQGSQFVNAFRQQGWTWQDMSVLYTNPPLATEHILHPDTYLEMQKPVPFEFSLASQIKGSRVLTGSVWGELGYRQMLSQHLGWKEAKAAAAGWRGDRYEVVETSDGLVFALFSLWDNDAEARGFYTAWRQALAVRDPQIQVPPNGGAFTWGKDSKGNKTHSWIEVQGSSVAIVENLSESQVKTVPALRKAWLAEAAARLKAAPKGSPVKAAGSSAQGPTLRAALLKNL